MVYRWKQVELRGTTLKNRFTREDAEKRGVFAPDSLETTLGIILSNKTAFNSGLAPICKISRAVYLNKDKAKKKKKKKLLVFDNMAKKIRSVGRNEILFYFEILFFDTASPDTTVDPLAVTMLLLSISRCLYNGKYPLPSWYFGWRFLVSISCFPVLVFFYF
jgi:hypothetical protein